MLFTEIYTTGYNVGRVDHLRIKNSFLQITATRKFDVWINTLTVYNLLVNTYLLGWRQRLRPF